MPQTTNKIELAIVSYELAVMLKELGFDAPVRNYFNYMKEEVEARNRISWNKVYADGDIYSAPELALVQVWLLKTHGLYCSVYPKHDLSAWYAREHDSKGYENIPGVYDSHDSALTAAILYSLNKIKEQGK